MHVKHVLWLHHFRYCESRRGVALAHVHEGYEKDLWEYHDYL